MAGIFIGLAIVMTILIFAMVGFFTFLSWLFSSKDVEPKEEKPLVGHPTLIGDALASRRLIDHLRFKGEISEEVHSRLRGFLNEKFPDSFEAPTREQIATPDREPVNPFVTPPPVIQPQVEPQPTGTAQPMVDSIELADVNEPIIAAGSDDEVSTGVTFVGDAAIDDVAPKQPVTSNVAETGSLTAVEPIPAATKPAPWDLPDPPAPTPRRSFGELMSGFMQEKNMRWGELTSGILIVLSAVGLVVSLREELRDTIPYFSSLLFMLITAAIHGAGIYTLRKWKLRNTSRGTLVIGLLLVPLNFVAACILSDPSSLNDPWLWAAIIIGLVSFTTMTWWSSKHLLRRGQLPMTIAVIGCGIGTLVLNRTVETVSSSLQFLLLSLPVLASFLVGSCAFDQRQWIRSRWSERASNRAFLFLGVSAFAAISALTLVVYRADAKLTGLVSVAPIASIICIVTSWLGSTISRGVVDSKLLESVDQNQAALAANEEERAGKNGLRVAGLALKVLGLVMLAASLIASLSNPTVFVANSILSAIGLIAMFVHQKDERLMPIAWGVLAFGILIAVNLATRVFSFDQWTTAEQLQAALVNGKSGLCLLLVGAGVAGANTLLQNQVPRLKNDRTFRVRGWMAGGAIFLAGCVIALIASLIHRDNMFDVMTASGLLLVAAVGLLVVCVITDRKMINQAIQLPHFAAILLLGALAHSLIWNPTIAQWLRSSIQIGHAPWVVMFAIHSMILVGVGMSLGRSRSDANLESDSRPKSSAGQLLMDWAAGSTLMLVIGALSFITFQSGWATAMMVVACVSSLLIGRSWVRNEAQQKSFAAFPFVLTSAMVVSVLIAELISKTSWCPPTDSLKHLPVQLVGLSIWSMVCSIFLAGCRHRPNWNWLMTKNLKVDQVILFALVIVVGGLIGNILVSGAAAELVKETTIASSSLSDSIGLVAAALAAVGAAMLVSTIITPAAQKGLALIVIWLLAWAFGAQPFSSSTSVASALRWLVPIGGALGALLIAGRKPILPAWSAMRNKLALSGPSRWKKSSTQQLINIGLTLVAGVVLVISTITVSQVLLNGAGSLGGPDASSWFRKIPYEISFGVPVAIVVGTFLLFAISERRSWLATLGSAVFQYVVVLAVVLLYLSPHPKLASSWFINILKSVSIGMTGYGFIWFWLRERIEGEGSQRSERLSWLRRRWISQIEIHTLINGLLITSLAVLAMGRFYFVPDQPGAWISTVGSPMGVVAWAAFGFLSFCVWRNTVTKKHSTGTWVWLVGWMGLILVGLAAAVIDRTLAAPEDFIAWLPFRAVMIGALIVGLAQSGLAFWLNHLKTKSESDSPSESPYLSVTASPQHLAWPILLSSAIALTFAARGAWLDVSSFWLYFGTIIVVTVLTTVIGWMLRDGKLAFVSTAVATLGASILYWKDPIGWFGKNQPDWINLIVISGLLIAIAWTVFYMVRQRQQVRIENEALREQTELRWSFVLLPNLVMAGAAIWMIVSAVLQYLISNLGGAAYSSLDNPLGISAFALTTGLAGLSLWNDKARFRVFSWCSLTVSLAIAIPAIFVADDSWRFVGVMIGVALAVAAWGVFWLNRQKVFGLATRWGASHLERLESSMRIQLPTYSLMMGSIAMLAALGVIFQLEERPHRYLAALVPFTLAIGIGAQSNQSERRWLQIATLGLATIGVLFLAWADLTRVQMQYFPSLKLLVRSLIVLAGTMFVYGGLVTRWVRPGDTWLKSLREMAVVTCGLAICNLVVVLFTEFGAFTEGVGCGLAIGESVTVAILVAGMITGLIIIALRPENDPFALSLSGRMGYVYAAEFVGLALIAHLYFSMPFLFQIGIKAYWPYIVMAICFGGVGIAQVLEKRNLKVLAQPLFNSAVVLPLIVAGAIFAVDSKAQPELVMVTVGLAYLMVSFTHKSLLSGAAAIVFGNLALWMFFNRAEFSFFDHPQLWLIPPAVSTLIAGQLSRNSLSDTQLSSLRYICVIVIYVSSTMEIFISGIGDNLWPPVILAILSVAGIMCGMMFRVKSFLYFGSLFLLMAMITMVAHAHQRLDHVWPWWAFGIGLGMAILVMFGLFEKKKNEMKALADNLKNWEA